MVESLKSRALAQLRAWCEDGIKNECYSIKRLAKALDCTELELYDWNHDTGVLFELYQDGDIGFTSDQECVYPQGGVMKWNEF